ncbi:ATP-dependent RNA helicase TDRD9 [Ambystoma mexicanum]|uniref:ATP-dependent RNA helicase TDRD9 n=1 Tax=Ambystoma mexicanum TaxID=8296 RepID=UPI0037E802F4
MLKNLTYEQITDWFTIGKTVANVQFLGPSPTLPAPKQEPAPTAWGDGEEEKPERDYIQKYRLQEEQEVLKFSFEDAGKVQAPRTVAGGLDKAMCIPDSDYKYPDLPISKDKDELMSLIEYRSVLIVRGATGSGKSTQLPQFVLDHCIKRSSYCNIVVTQPRKIGATSIARWISNERKWVLGGLVGYQVGLDKMATKDTKLIYMTTGVLLQKIVAAKSLGEFTHIFVDEVHERTEEMDFLLLVIRKLLRTNSRWVKVILMSATINCKEFADYFAVPVHYRMFPAYVHEVEGKPHAIEEYYLDDLNHIALFKVPEQHIDEPAISRELYEVAASLIQLFDNMEMKEMGEDKKSHTTAEPNSVLVFLPGLAEINYMHELFTSMVHKRLHIYPLHSSITMDEQNAAFSTPVYGYRKVILSTNIAESSVTVPDVKYVIDFCLTRTLVSDEDTNYQSLRLSWASKTSCNQRKGRAGRVSKGYCYRLIHKEFWNSFIPEHVVPEMLRCPLGNTILKVKLLDMGEPRALLATALSPPKISDIEHTILVLKEIGALAIGSNAEEENPHDGVLTFLGMVLAELPVDLYLGKLIVLGHVFGCLEECLIIAAGLSLKSFFAMPYRQHLDGYRNKMNFSGNSRSDCIALVEAFKAWRTCRESGELRRAKDELEWGRANYLQMKRVREVADLFEELKKRIMKFNMFVDTPRPAMDPEYSHKRRFILQIVMAGAFYPNYFMYGTSDEELALRELGANDPKTTIVLKNVPPYGFLYQKQIQSLFRQCGQVKSITFDGSKAFVEFSRNPTERFKTLPAVYMSLKMAQLRVPLKLSIHSAEEIEGKSEETVTVLRQTRIHVDFQKQMVEPVHISFGVPEQVQTITSLNLSINVTEVVEVGHFWGYRIDEKNLAGLRNLTTQISHQQLLPLQVRPHPDLVCLAPFSDSETCKYYRAQILFISGEDAEVFFVDYGNRSRMKLNILRHIPSHLLELPFQALEFKICNMRPSAKSLMSGEQWSCAASQRFATLVNGCALIVKVYSVVHNVLHVNVYRHSGNQMEMSIRDMLIDDGFAEPAEESYESKQSHEMLKDQVSTSKRKDAQQSCYRNGEKELIRTLTECSNANKFGTPSCKVMLFGPTNPYEVRFHSLTRISRFRSVWIEKESINSVLVNDAPVDNFQRMLVSAYLSVNASGSTIMLRETSLMPNIPGLPAILSMLFAPVIELRIDQQARSYTGVLCGLGWNRSLGAPVLKDHDIELAFDAHFNPEDIVEINILRDTINKLVCCGPNGPLFLGQERTAQLQEDARHKLLRLICRPKPREVISPKWNEKPYEWNQVDPMLLISPGQKNIGKNAILYQLHNLIVLNP